MSAGGWSWSPGAGQVEPAGHCVTLSSETEACEVLFGKGTLYTRQQGGLANMFVLVPRARSTALCTARAGDLAKGRTVSSS